jgi:hypothetical protein
LRGIYSDKQGLVFAEKILDDEHTFSYYGIKHQNIISVIQTDSGGMKIDVEVLNGSFKVRVNPTDQVDYLKALVRLMVRDSFRDVRFMYRGGTSKTVILLSIIPSTNTQQSVCN